MTMLVKEAMEQNLPIILFKGHNGVITLTHDKQWIKAKKDIDTRKEYVKLHSCEAQYNAE